MKAVFYWETITVYLLNFFSIALLTINKAFDSVWHEGLWAVMKSYGMDQKLIRLIKAIYRKTRTVGSVS